MKLQAASALARKKLGLRYAMSVVPLDPAPRPRHPRAAARRDPTDGPVLLCSDPALAREKVHATEVKELLLAAALRTG